MRLAAQRAACKSIGERGSGVTSDLPDLLQGVSAPTRTNRLEGIAVRVCYALPDDPKTTMPIGVNPALAGE